MSVNRRQLKWNPDLSHGKASIINSWEAFIREHCGPAARTMQYLCLPSRTGWELKVYDGLGVDRKRIVGIERLHAIGYDMLVKDWGIPVFAGELIDFPNFLAARPDFPQTYDIINVDVCGTVSGEKAAIETGIQLALAGKGRCLSVTTNSSRDFHTLEDGARAFNYIRSVLAGNPSFAQTHLHLLRELTVLLKKNDVDAEAKPEILRELAFIWTVATTLLKSTTVTPVNAILQAYHQQNGGKFRTGTINNIKVVTSQDFSLARSLGDIELPYAIDDVRRFIYISNAPARMRTWFYHFTVGPPRRFATVLIELLEQAKLHQLYFYDQNGRLFRL